MAKAPAEPGPWRSGFCTTYPHPDWQRESCHGGHTRTPTKDDPRDWVPCACPCHTEETPMTTPDWSMPGITEDNLEEALLQVAREQTETFDASLLDDPGPPLPIALQLLQLATDRLSEAAVGNIETLDWEDAIRHLDQLRTAAEKLRQLDSLLVRCAYLAGPHGRNVAELDGIGPVSITRTADRKKWDERGVARAVIDAHMAEAENLGEAPDPWKVAEWLLEVYGVDYCRVTPLRTLGLEPKAFCEETPGKPTVQLPPRT